MTEGDNTVMSQQTAKYLLKQVQEGQINLDDFQHSTESLDEQILLLFEIRFKTQLKTAAMSLQTATGSSFMENWNESSLQSLIQASVFYLQYWALHNFDSIIRG